MKKMKQKKAVIVVAASHSAWLMRQGMIETTCQVVAAVLRRHNTDTSVLMVHSDLVQVLGEHLEKDVGIVASAISSVHPKGHTVLGNALGMALDRLPEGRFDAELFVISGTPVDDTRLVDSEIARRVSAGTLKLHKLTYGEAYAESAVPVHDWVDLRGQFVSIDGANVSGWSTRKGYPNIHQALAVCRAFRMGGVAYSCWFDASFYHNLEKSNPDDARLFNALLANRPEVFKVSPAGLLNGQPVKADIFVLEDAKSHNGWYLGNDLYRNEVKMNPARYGWVQNSSDRRICGQVSGNFIYLQPIGWQIKINENNKER